MKQSNNNKKSRDVTAFLYERLSRDDNMDGESYSIGNQKKLLTKVAKEKGYTNLVHFFDDGISGVTMDRPGFADMIQQLEQGKAAAVFVKDLSRLGRNYIEVGRLTEEFFPNHDIRLVAVSDNIDTDEGENELAPIRNLFNEWYARDISKKRRISNKIKGNAGEPMGQPPYGYVKDPENPKRWIVDEEAARVVRRIYRMTLEGVGTEQIAAKLEEDGILTPRAYWHSKGINRPGKVKDLPPTHWNSSSVIKMLSVQEYCGDILNFKTYSKSYKNKKRLENDRENWAIFKDVHEPIIERAVFEQVQQKRGKMRKRQAKDGERSMFSGLLVCADCGSNLHFHFNQGNPEIKYFNCSNYKGNRGTCGSTHYVRVDFLEQVVLGEIRRLTKYAGLYEDDFLKEARVLSQFGTQEGIVRTRSFFEENDSVYLVMDYVRGGSIKDYVKRNGPFSPQNCWNILHNPIRALLDLHQKGLVHQDVSPDNVIINAEGNGVLIDFGAVRHANAIDDKTRTSIYKQGFSAYEQLEKRGKRGPWTDVYSLCATIYYMLTGQAPIDATERVFNDTIKPLWEYPVDITKDVAEVIMHGLAVESGTRLQTLDELYETLYECPAHRKDMAEVVESASVLGESREAMREEALGKQKRRERHIHHLSDQLEQMERRRKHKKWVVTFGIIVGVLAVISGIGYRQMAADHGKAEMKPPVIASAEPTGLPEDQAGRSVVPQADVATASTEPTPTATEPVRTKKPKATKHPVRTKKPKVIKTPEVAATPKRTKAPKKTKKPTKIHMDGDMDELTE